MIESEIKSRICLIDSNIWLYAFIETQDVRKSGIAKAIIRNVNAEIAVSTQIINEVCVNLIRKVGFSEEKIRELAETFYDKYNVLEINRENLVRASEIREHHNFSFWDSLILASALCVDAEILYSEDMQNGFVVEKTTIVDPFNQPHTD